VGSRAIPESDNSRLVLVDGSRYIFRAFFTLPPLTDPNGVPDSAVFGFCNMLFRLVQDMPGDDPDPRRQRAASLSFSSTGV
jgi:DNA polymerase-1